MTAGMPGTGIGGLFYLICALWMPFHETISVLRGRDHSKARWAVILTQTAIALGICFAIWFTGWALGVVLWWLRDRQLLGMSHLPGHEVAHNLLGPLPFVIAAGTLLLNLAVVQVARLFFSEDLIIDASYKEACSLRTNEFSSAYGKDVRSRVACLPTSDRIGRGRLGASQCGQCLNLARNRRTKGHERLRDSRPQRN